MKDEEKELGINRFAGLEFLAFNAVVTMLLVLVLVTVYASAAWLFSWTCIR